MAAPEYVPRRPDTVVRSYVSPPRRTRSWMADRPAEIAGRQPLGDRLGSPGPDQGFAIKLARRFAGTLVLAPSEREEDALAGCLAIAMRRSALFGRAPVVHDLRAALSLWNYLMPASAELTALRSRVFASVASVHHHTERRAIVDAVPEDVLRATPEQIAARVAEDPAWVLDMARAVADAQSGHGTH